VHAHAAVVAEATDRGCAFPTLRSDPPLLLRPTPDALYLQGGAAGPLGGDRLRLDIHGDPDDALAWRNSAVIGDGRVVAGEVMVGMAAAEPPATRCDDHDHDQVPVARLPLGPDATLGQAVGADVSAVDRMMSACCADLIRASPSTWR
jgi:hypothetical protein